RLANEQLVDIAAQMETVLERNRVKIARLEQGRAALLEQAERSAHKADTEGERHARTQADKLSEMIEQLHEENVFTEEAFEEALLVMRLAEAELARCRKSQLFDTPTYNCEAITILRS